MRNDSPRLLSSAEAATILGIHQTTVSGWVASGRLKAAHKLPGLRGAYLFAPSEVERVRATQTAEAAS